MVSKSKLVFLSSVIIVALSSCFKDREDVEETIIKPNPKIIISSAQLVVKVTDETGEDLTGISADLNNEIKVVDKSSIFYFNTKNISKEDEVLTITDKQGETFQYKIYSIENEVNYYHLCVFKNYVNETLSTTISKDIHFPSGQTVACKGENYLQGANSYTGTIQLKYHEYDLKNELHRKSIPGGNTLLDKGIRKIINFKEVFRFDMYDNENRSINFKNPIAVKLNKEVGKNDAILYYNKSIRDWEIADVTYEKNEIYILKSGTYALASLQEFSVLKGAITFNNEYARNEKLIISFENQTEYVASTNNGRWECLVPNNIDITINLEHNCIAANPKVFQSKKEINDVGIINYESNNLGIISIKANVLDCNEKPIDQVLVLLKSSNNNSYLLMPSSTISFEQNICGGDLPTLSIIGNDIQSETYLVANNKIDLDQLMLCSNVKEEYLLIKDDQGNSILYDQLNSSITNQSIVIDFYKNDDKKLNFIFNHNNVEGEINPIKSNMVWFDVGFGSKGIEFNCPTSNDCGFSSLQLTYLNHTSAFVRGKFKGRFWTKTSNPISATYKNIEGHFQIKK